MCNTIVVNRNKNINWKNLKLELEGARRAHTPAKRGRNTCTFVNFPQKFIN